MQGLGPIGGVLYAVSYAFFCLFFPASILTLAAGFLFGLYWGFLVVNLGALAGACLAFYLARSFGRAWVERKITKHPRFLPLDRAVERQGWKVVFLTRLSPVFPFLFLNYAFGLTQVRFRDYFTATWLGIIPGGLLYVYLGSLATHLADLANGGKKTAGEQVFYWAGLGLTVFATIYIARLARRALKGEIT